MDSSRLSTVGRLHRLASFVASLGSCCCGGRVAGAQEITPKVWLTKVSAVLPESGYHVRWHGLMMEEARGITLHALALSRESRLVMQLLQHNLNRTQAGCWGGGACRCTQQFAGLLS